MKHCLVSWGLLGLACIAPFSFASALQDNLDQANAIQADAKKSQQKVDRIANETQALLDEYQRLLADSDYQQQYLAELNALDKKQQAAIDDLTAQLQTVQFTQQKMGPLLKTMLDALEQFVVLDLPFHQKERINSVLMLREQVEDASVSLSQKYRLIMQAFQVELAYSDSLEAYRGRINEAEQALSVEFLRVGRVALYYQTLDGENSAMWDKHQRAWIPLDSAFNRTLSNGIRVARNQVAPQLLTLPISTSSANKSEVAP